jgi:cysteine desulfurase family protein (TIGR01976 family)
MPNLGPPATAGAQASPSNFPIDEVRAQFPALALRLAGAPVAYFDNPAGTQVPRRVIEGVSRYFSEANANSHGDFLTSQRTDSVIKSARELGAAFLGASSPSEIAFGANMTTLTYSLSQAIGQQLSPGDEIVVTDLDHDANISPWLELEQRGVVIRRIPIQVEDCTLDLTQFSRLLSSRTRLVAVGLASNAVGTINDIARITALSHAVGAWVWVDAVHYAPHGPIDVQELGCDFLVCSAYKFFGPHVGLFWGRAELLEQIRPPRVRPAPDVVPDRFETGTKCHEGLAGLVETFRYLAALGGGEGSSPGQTKLALGAAMRSIRRYELGLARLLLDGLTSLRGLRLIGLREIGDLERRVPTFAFTLEGLTSADVSRRLAEQGVFTWAGNHYALTLMERLDLEARGGVVRVGAVHYNNGLEVQRLVEALSGLARR